MSTTTYVFEEKQEALLMNTNNICFVKKIRGTSNEYENKFWKSLDATCISPQKHNYVVILIRSATYFSIKTYVMCTH